MHHSRCLQLGCVCSQPLAIIQEQALQGKTGMITHKRSDCFVPCIYGCCQIYGQHHSLPNMCSVADASRSSNNALPQLSATPQASSSDGPANGCKIKGNINAKGEKIYHMPGSQYYERTQIDLPQGERWFCTERQAKDAGWRSAQ